MSAHRLFTIFFLIICGCACTVHSVGDVDPVPPIEDLDGMIAYLRHEDTRLIRYNIPSDLAKLRQEKLCSQHLKSILKILSTRFDANSKVSFEEQAKIIHLVTLCSSENPENRKAIGTFESSVVLKAIVSLIDENNDSITAVVGQAVWILSFANQHNHDYFAEHAIDKMASIIVTKSNALKKNEINASDRSPAIMAVMWMAAALQNLAASYCDTESGHCWWEYDHLEHDESEEYGVYLDEDSDMMVDGSKAAEAIALSVNGELVESLHKLICEKPMGEEDYKIWASETTIEGAGNVDLRIITWAVAGLLKNLSMYEASHTATIDAKDCLCALAQSEDWLESSKAEDALFRSGFTEEDCLGQDNEENYEDSEEYYEDSEEYYEDNEENYEDNEEYYEDNEEYHEDNEEYYEENDEHYEGDEEYYEENYYRDELWLVLPTA